MPNPRFNRRALEERSYLAFEFPQTNGRDIRAYLPFLENCEVSENKRANLGDYSLLSRSNSLYSYLGAKSRVINLRFKITLLHVIEQLSKEGIDDRFRRQFQLFFTDKEAAKKAFFLLQTPGGLASMTDVAAKKGMEHARIHREYYQKIANIKGPASNIFDEGINQILEFLGSPTQSQDQRYAELNKVIDMIIYWINLVRSSVNNNAKDTTLGPPTVRLTHGPMYNNIACVVDSYSVRIDDAAGFDVQTLFPKQLEITMTLNENKVGNFGEFKANQFVDKDNNNGWEVLIDSNNMDPYGGLINGRI